MSSLMWEQENEEIIEGVSSVVEKLLEESRELSEKFSEDSFYIESDIIFNALLKIYLNYWRKR